MVIQVILIHSTQKTKTYLLLQTDYKLSRKIKLESYVCVQDEENISQDDEDQASILERNSSEDVATITEENSISEFTSSSSESEYLSDSSAKDAEHTNNDDVDVLLMYSVSFNVTTPADDKDYDVGQDREWKKKKKERFSGISDQPEGVMFSFLFGGVRY